MQRSVVTLSMVLSIGFLGARALAGDGVLSKDKFVPESFCHMKFPAIRERTLGMKHPQLKSSDTGDVIDFYGPCDEGPTGSDQVTVQRREEERRWKEYLDRG